MLGFAAGHAAGWSACLVAFTVLGALTTPLLIVDIEHHRLPDRLIAPAAIGGLILLSIAAAVRHDWSTLGRSVAAGGIVTALFGALAVASPSSIGLGDVKLSGVIAIYLGWLGWSKVLYGIFAGFAIGAVIATILLACRRASRTTTIPFGPELIVGALLAAAWH